MPPVVNRATLQRFSAVSPTDLADYQAAQMVERLGWLALWWLGPEVRRRAAQRVTAYRRYIDQPALPREPGCCWAVLVRDPAFTLLSEAFLLPLRWDRAGHDPHLPPPLRDLAEQVLGQIEGAGTWGLRLDRPEGEEVVDLSELTEAELGASSAWASLVGGLQLARDGSCPEPGIWASAAWDERYGVGGVAGVAAKLSLAESYGARRMFVPAANQAEASGWQERHPGSALQVGLLRPEPDTGKRLSATQVLSDYLEQLETQPARDESFERRRGYYARVGRRLADEYYWTHLLHDAIDCCREALDERVRAAAPTHVVTVVGNQPPVVALAPAVLRAQRCLLLYEAPNAQGEPAVGVTAIERNRDRVATFLEANGIEVASVGLTLGDRDGELAQVLSAVGEFLDGVDPSRVAIDLTPGYKSLSLELLEAAPRGCWLLYCRHKQRSPDNRVDPGTERYDCWQRK